MRETFQCGDHGALITYLYDECAPEERETIATHLARCVTCTAELSGLTSTRQAIAMWTPPAVDLGLQITRKVEAELAAPSGSVLAFARPQAASVERSIPWWRAPLPAWAQAAAAVAIFAAGLSVGFMRNGTSRVEPQETVAVNATPPVATPTKADLAALEQRLRTDMTQLVHTNSAPAPAPVTARSGDDAIMQRVQALIAESEVRQNRELTERMVRQASVIEAQRRVDLDSLGRNFGQVTTELRQQRQWSDEINRTLAQRVSQRP